MKPISRRSFLQATAGATLAAHAAPSRQSLQEFSYADVQLTGGPLKRQYDHLHQHFLSLDNDRLLKVYRQRAGLPAPGEDMGGWYDADGFVPGHTIGQYISGLSRYASATSDAATIAKVRALVEGYAATLGPDGYPYASKKADTTWPCYILDKYEIGMIDACRLAGVKQAREVLSRIIRGAIPHIPDHTYDRGPDSPKQAPYDEPYILPENLFNSYELTGDRQFLEMAKLYLLNDLYFDPLAQGRNLLPGKHAYSHVIALSSAAKAYEVLGDEKYLKAIRNAWDMLEETQEFASGGWGPKEAFVPPGEGKLGESLTTTRDHFETPCGAYAHMKLARYLVRFTAQGRYGDGLERIIYNTILGSLDPGGDGEYFYYSDYQSGATKGYYKRKWPCCSGTLVQGVADYPLGLYFHSADVLYVNMFAPSRVKWTAGRTPVTLTQTTNYPKEESSELRVDVPASAEFTMQIRIPGWLKTQPRIAVNGKSFDVAAQPGNFAAIRRKWNKGDTVEVRFPMSFRAAPVDDQHPKLAAVMRGPVMYVAANPPSGFGGSLRISGKPEIPLQPFYETGRETYTTYFDIR
jgi:DUF1680 family protein